MSCVCEQMFDDMRRRWFCEEHGEREPNYNAIFDAEFLKALEYMDARVKRINRLTREINR